MAPFKKGDSKKGIDGNNMPVSYAAAGSQSAGNQDDRNRMPSINNSSSNHRSSSSSRNSSRTNTNEISQQNHQNEQQYLTGEAPYDDFPARRSSRVAAGRYAADNDTWVEALAVCEMPNKKGNEKKQSKGGLLSKLKSKSGNSSSNNATTNISNNREATYASNEYGEINLTHSTEAEIAEASQRLSLRPYFQSQNTRQRVWDEPPSGASKIMYATSEARKMAQAQLEEMRATYAQAALVRKMERNEEKALMDISLKEAGIAAKNNNNNSGGKVSSVLGRSLSKAKLFRHTSSSSSASATNLTTSDNNNNASRVRRQSQQSPSSSNYIYEGHNAGVPPSILHESIALAAENNNKSNNSSFVDNNINSYEKDLQMAMLMSMGIGGGSVMGVGVGGVSPDVNGKTKSKSHSAPSSRRNSQQKKSSSKNNKHQHEEHSLLTKEEQEQLAMATALSLSEEEAKRNSKISAKQHRSHSSSRRSPCTAGISNGADGRMKRSDDTSNGKRSQSTGRHSSRNNHDYSNRPPLSGELSSRSKSTTSSHQQQYHHHQMHKAQVPTLAPTDDSSSDGGGKMPALKIDDSFGDFLGVKDSAAPNANTPNTVENNDNFGNKGCEWELEWIHEEKKTNHASSSKGRHH